MSSNFKTLVPILAMLLALSGCGDLLGRNVVKRQLDGSQFEANCTLDMNKFSEIMHENISSQIRCLGENLNTFIKIVKSGKPGYLSKVQLERYLADFRPDVAPEVVKALGAVFQVGHLITGEDPNYISKDTVDKVINFALVFNQEAALNFGPIFKNESPVTYALHMNHRERVSNANKAIVQSLRTIFNPNRNGETHKINIIELLESFTTETNRHSIENAKKILFAKGVLFGGKNDELSHTELEKLILNFDHLLLLGLDVARHKYIILSQNSMLQLIMRDVGDLYDIITQGTLNDRDGMVLFTLDEAIAAAKLFLDDGDFKIDDYKNLIAEFKVILMKGNKTQVKGKELKTLFTHAKSVLLTGTVFHRIYDKFKENLNKPTAVNIDFSEYRHTYPEQQAELDQFERIVKRYKFMKGAQFRDGEFFKLPSAFYTREYYRNPDAMFEIALFEYGIKLLFSAYGSPSPNSDAVGGFSIDKDQMQALVKKFENELINLDLLLPQRAAITADNISLLGSLFQYQSDKNKVMDVNEATEFGLSLMTSLKVADKLYNYMVSEKCEMDEFNRIMPDCFRRTFWKGLCTHYKEYYPLMFNYLNGPAKCEDFENTNLSSQFLDRAIIAARTCHVYTDQNREEIPYTEGDIMTIMLVLIHSETTVLRWDANNNNVMDADEVNNAYEIYSPALDGFLEDKSPIIKKFKKQIYQYMIKYEAVPNEKDFGSIWKFVKFLLSFNKKAPANRKTIASLLVAIGEENKKLQTGPQLDCNLLRDPNNIPRDPKPMNRPVANNIVAPVIDVPKVLPYTVSIITSYTSDSREVFKAEMEEFSQDMIDGSIKNIKNIRQPNLKRIFKWIAADKAEMKRIEALISEGSELHKIGYALSLVLIDENLQ